MDFLSQMARLRVASETGVLPPDLGRWLQSKLIEGCQHVEIVQLRNALICQAAARMVGSRKDKAIQIRREMLALDRRRGTLNVVQEILRSAIALDPRCPDSVRQILRILAIGDSNGPTLSPDFGLG